MSKQIQIGSYIPQKPGVDEGGGCSTHFPPRFGDTHKSGAANALYCPLPREATPSLACVSGGENQLQALSRHEQTNWGDDGPAAVETQGGDVVDFVHSEWHSRTRG